MKIIEINELKMLKDAVSFLEQVAPEQVKFVTGDYFKHGKNHFFGAINQEHKLLGVIRYCEQEIGLEQSCPIIEFQKSPLKEAKINAFAVHPDHRNQGIGKKLQLHVINHAKSLGLYQVSSYSTYDKVENYAVKLRLGFCVQPEKQTDGTIGCYFIMRL